MAAHLKLTHIRPSNPEGLFLNEEIVFYFSEELDPSSVTGASIEIRSQEGRVARGELRVESDRVRFVPAAVLAADLSDGAYSPGTKYTVTLAGFPRPEGVRSLRGNVLEKTWVWSFRTVEVAQPRTGLVFEDRMQDRVGLLRLFPTAGGQGGLIRAQDSIYLACDKPIDPSSLSADSFRLVLGPSGLKPAHSTASEPMGIRVRVIENESEVKRRPKPAVANSSSPPESWERESRASLIELTPLRKLAAGAWELRLGPETGDAEPRLRDFGGKPVLFAESTGAFGIRVDDPSAEVGRGEQLGEEFVSRQLRSPVAVPGYDGTAYWGQTGRVEVRYPAAAGSGDDGAVTLGSSEDRLDVQATSIDLPEGSVCKLNARPGLVVLRCQGRMTIRGRMSREALWDPQAEASRDPRLEEWFDLSKARRIGPQTLSDWLAEERARNGNWTVLIAGGDLEIDDALTTTTPLLLVAGGRIRVLKTVQGAQRQIQISEGLESDVGKRTPEVGGVYLLGEGGGGGISPSPSQAPIVADQPHGPNPLKVPLRFAVLSGPIPPRGDVARWLPAESGGSPSSGDETSTRKEPPISGSWRVRFVPELSGTPAPGSTLTPVDSPALIDPPGPVQFLIELDVDTQGVWNPPWVDYVNLAWEQPVPREGPAGGDR